MEVPQLPKLYESEYRLCQLVWAHEPIGSGDLVRLCQERLGWKPTTTYTVIKRLSDKGVLKNERSVVSSLVSKAQVQDAEVNELLERTFEGSLPAFLNAFMRQRRMTGDEMDEVQKMIDQYREENENA